jgi:hypothetical protein
MSLEAYGHYGRIQEPIQYCWRLSESERVMVERLLWMSAGVGVLAILFGFFCWLGWIVSIIRHGAVATRVIEDAVKARQNLECTVREQATALMPLVERIVQAQKNLKV